METVPTSLGSNILAAFTALPGCVLEERLAQYSLRDWRRLGTWLHASGLALYLLDRLRTRNLLHRLPPSVVTGLQQNQLDNRERIESLEREFVRLNTVFRRTGLDCLNIKGFSLGREYCPNPALRSQFDLDFWLREDQAADCADVMTELGYRVVETPGTLSCHSGDDCYPRLRDFYKPPSRRVVEIHLRPAPEFATLPRANGLLNCFVFPTLSRERMFVQQACHLAKHLRSEWTRASWLLELRNAIQDARGDHEFWNGVAAESAAAHASTMVGLAVAATARVFHIRVPLGLRAWSTDSLTPPVSRWVDQFAERVVTAQFPGSKFYLLLERELARDDESFRRRRRSVLLPLRLPGYISRENEAPAGIRTVLMHANYIGQRIVFHAREGMRFLRAERVWQKQADESAGCVIQQSRGVA